MNERRQFIEVVGLADRLERIELLLGEIASKLASTASSASSVQVNTSTRGVDITTKAYAGSPITEAGDAALEEFLRVGREVEKRLMGQA